MFRAISVKRPTEGSILRAGKGYYGAFDGGPAPQGVSEGDSAGNGGPGPCQ